MYEVIVGEGRCQPLYFLREMQWWEVKRYIAGMRRAERTQWSTTRWLGWVVSSIMGGKSESPEAMMPFPWERTKPKGLTEDEYNALMEQIRAENEAAS